MKKILAFILLGGLLMTACQKERPNPFFSNYNTPFETPAFDKIQKSDYLPAFYKGIEEKRKEINEIANSNEPPTFENTILAMENAGALLRKVSGVFFNLNSALTDADMQKIAKEISPKLAALEDDIKLNKKLFARVKTVYENRDKENLDPVQMRLLEEYYKDFVRGGANLEGEKEKRFREINQELSKLTLKFGENVLAENNRFEMVIDNKDDLAGLPEGVIKAAEEAAKERGHEGKWVFTLHKPSLIPFLQYSEKRDLRKKMLLAYAARGDHNDELDNKAILSKIAALRVERANLLGYKTHADFILDDNMAKTPANVYNLLNQVWKPALAKAKEERAAMQKMINDEGGKFKLEAWDWWYYAEKIKKAKYDLDEKELRPYFKLENVRAGAFMVANKLYGITFTKRTDIPVYHPDVEVFEVKDADGSHIGILYTDYFPRASKRGGAWMNAYRMQAGTGKDAVTPIICNVCNFSKPTGDKPALLSLEEVQTLFHEFGHGLHGLLSKVKYRSLAGTAVKRDFVELFSQIMENWATDPTVLKLYAKHYETGEPMPDELIEKIQKSSHFNQGFATTEYLAAAFLDMDWHTLTEPVEQDVHKFEKASMNKIGLIPEIIVRYKSPYFRHIFAGGYSAGYYSYIWAEVLDADAFQAFKEEGIFNRETGMRFRNEMLSKGNTADPMTLYVNFRGKKPSIEPLLERRGLQ